jgi:hypothetical protein
MSQFSYAQYQQVVAHAQSSGDGTKVGFFKLKDDGDIAIARINISCNEDMDFASVHTIGANGRWMKVSCLNPLGSYGGDCALCAAHAANPKGSISKSAKKLFIQMMVSYRDPNAEGGYTTPAPVIWDRPAAFSRELANKLMIAGDLRNTLVLITRNGKAGDMQTTYSMDILPENHPVFKPDMVPADFSAFNNFNIARHSYWEKSAEEINTYLTTGQFPEKAGNAAAPAAAIAPQYTPQTANTYAGTAYAAPAHMPTQMPPAPVAAPAAPVAAPAPMPNVAPVTQPTVNAGAPARNFNGFSF